MPIPLHYDNVAAVSITKNPILYDKMKHVELDVHFVRDLVASYFLSPIHISSHLSIYPYNR